MARSHEPATGRHPGGRPRDASLDEAIILATHDAGAGDLGDQRPLLPYTLRHSNLPLHSPLQDTRKPRL